MADFHSPFLLMSNIGIDIVLSLKLYSFLHEAMWRLPAVTVMSDTILPGRMTKRSIEIRSDCLIQYSALSPLASRSSEVHTEFIYVRGEGILRCERDFVACPNHDYPP
jgi:hypothetical protein